LSVQPELLYSYNGSRAEGGIFKRHSLTIPLNLQLNLVNEGGGLYRFYPFAGPYYSYSFAGSLGKDALDFENDYQDQELGLQYGFGFDINKVQLRFTAAHALDPIFRDSKSKVLSKGAYFTIGYKF
jgi:aminopeptidase YwaD